MKKRRALPVVPALPLALLAAGLAGAASLVALRRAITRDDDPAVARETIVIPPTLHARAAMSVAGDEAIADDPFFPGRTPPATRYQLVEAEAPSQNGQEGDLRVPIVLGTVVGADGSGFVIASVNGEQPRTVRLGGTIGDYRLASVQRNRAVFLTPAGQRLTVANSTSSGPMTDMQRADRMRDVVRRFDRFNRGDGDGADVSGFSSSDDDLPEDQE